MIQGIQTDVYVHQLASPDVQEKTGRYCGHTVRLGTGNAISLASLKATHAPYAGFRTAVRIERGKQGTQDACQES